MTAPASRPHARTRLTAKQAAVIHLVAQGWTNAKIAGYLDRTEDSVKARVSRAMRSVGARDRAHLVHIAHLTGLLTPDCGCRDRRAATNTTVPEGRTR